MFIQTCSKFFMKYLHSKDFNIFFFIHSKNVLFLIESFFNLEFQRCWHEFFFPQTFLWFLIFLVCRRNERLCNNSFTYRISRVSLKCMIIFLKKIVVLSSNMEDISLLFKSNWTRKRNFFKSCKNQGFIISKIHGFCFGNVNHHWFWCKKSFVTNFAGMLQWKELLQKEYDGAWNTSLQATKSEKKLQGTKGEVNELVAYHFHFKTISSHYWYHNKSLNLKDLIIVYHVITMLQ